jgi:hypothetical protein
MPHINSLGAAMYTDLAVATGVITSNTAVAATAPVLPADTSSISGFAPLFADETTAIAGAFRRVKNVRDFPSIGTPANIVNVPTYGSKTSRTIQGQADAPSLEVTINYIPSDWAKGSASGTVLGNMVGDGVSRVWRFTLLNVDSAGSTPGTKYSTDPLGLGTVQNSQFFFYGKLESLLVNPSLTDATTATLAFSLQSEFFGAYTSN